MTKGQVEDAKRKALNELDKWNGVTGAITPGSGWYYEIQSVIEDAVHIGIQMALYGRVNYDSSGSVIQDAAKEKSEIIKAEVDFYLSVKGSTETEISLT